MSAAPVPTGGPPAVDPSTDPAELAVAAVAGPGDAGPTAAGPDARQRDLAGLARGGAINLAGSIWQGVASYVVTLLVTRGTGSTALAGAFFSAIALFNIVAVTAKAGADVGIVRFIPHWRATGREGDARRMLALAGWPVLVVGLLAGGALWTFAQPLADLVSEGEGASTDAVATYARVLAFVIPMGALQMSFGAATRAFGSMVAWNVSGRLMKPTLQVVGLGVVFALDLGAVGIALAWGLPWGISALQLFLRARRDLAALPTTNSGGRRTSRPALAMEFWTFTAPRALAGFFQVGILWVDLLIVGALASQSDVGTYGAATRYLVIGSFVQLAVIHAIEPLVARALARRALDEAQDLFATGTAWVVAAVWPGFLLMAIFAPVLLGAFGDGYAEGATALRILCVAWLVAAGCGPVDTVLNMAGRTGWSMFDLFVALVANITLNLVLVPRYGINGAAVAWGASMLTHNLLPLVQVRRFLGLVPFSRGWATAARLALVVVLGGGTLGATLLGQTLTGLLVTSATVGAVYLWLLSRRGDDIGLQAILAGVRRR